MCAGRILFDSPLCVPQTTGQCHGKGLQMPDEHQGSKDSQSNSVLETRFSKAAQ